MNLTVMKVLVKTGLTWRQRLLMMTVTGLTMRRVGEEEEEAVTQQPGGRRRGETSRGPWLEDPPGRRSTTRVTDTGLQRRSTRVGIVTGREKGADPPRVPASPTRSPGARVAFLECVLYCTVYTSNLNNCKLQKTPVCVLNIGHFVTIVPVPGTGSTSTILWYCDQY